MLKRFFVKTSFSNTILSRYKGFIAKENTHRKLINVRIYDIHILSQKYLEQKLIRGNSFTNVKVLESPISSIRLPSIWRRRKHPLCNFFKIAEVMKIISKKPLAAEESVEDEDFHTVLVS